LINTGFAANLAVWTAEIIYMFEFKLNGTAEAALRQIDEKGCAIPYKAGAKQ
jgi:hypothetical protein